MTPAEELTAAADKLDGLIAGATQDWSHMDDVESQLFPEDLAYITAMNPLVGKALVEMLRRFEMACERDVRPPRWTLDSQRVDDRIPGLTAALDLARLINGGTS